MYDKSDPRSKLSTAKRDPNSGSTATPASYGLYYKDDPVETDANGKAWYTRGQDLLVNYIEAAPGATFARSGQTDEYMIVLPDENTPYSVSAKGETKEGPGHQVIIVPPGDSTISLPQGGRVVRLFSTQSDDLNAKCANAETYVEQDPNIPPFKPWPAPPAGYKLRVYDLWKERTPGKIGPIWRCTTIMLNFPPPGNGPRDLTKMSPHSHDDFDQCSLVLAGSFLHNMRWPWGLNKYEWRPDEYPITESPSATIIPARVIHSSETVHKTNNRMADIFAPPRLDFSLQEGWIQNADEYPLPEREEEQTA
jgi:hypothetical protein